MACITIYKLITCRGKNDAITNTHTKCEDASADGDREEWDPFELRLDWSFTSNIHTEHKKHHFPPFPFPIYLSLRWILSLS